MTGLSRFRQDRRGFWAAILLGVLLLFTLPAEFVANDRPLAISYVGYLYFPVLRDYPETAFGGDFETYADFTDGYLRTQIARHGWALWPLIPFSASTQVFDLAVPAPSPPSARNWLGTDERQRDVLARLIYGARTSLLVGLGVAVLCGVIGFMTGRRARLGVALAYLPAAAVAALAVLNFAGHGLSPDEPSLGGLLSAGWMNPRAPWLALSGSIVLAVVLGLFTVLGRTARRLAIC